MKKMFLLLMVLCSLSGVTFGNISWVLPTEISTPSTNASDPRVVIDNDGNVIALWIENNVIQARSLPFGGSWSTQVSLSNALNIASSPSLAIDGSGNVTAIWVENSLIKTASLPFEGSWSSASTISGSGASSPVLAVDDNNNAVSVWVRGGFIESSTRISGSWSLVSVLSVSNSSHPHVSINNTGKAAAAWHTTTGSNEIITSNILTLSGNVWGTSKTITSNSNGTQHNYPKVAIDAAGNTVAVWFSYNLLYSAYENVRVQTSSLKNGASTWGLSSLLSGSGMRNPADLILKVEFDINGDALAVWTNSLDGYTFIIESSRKIFNGQWPGPILLQVPSIYSFSVDFSIASGTALLANMAWDQVSAIQVLSQQIDVSNPVLQAWTQLTVMSSDIGNGYPKCGLSLNDNTLRGAVVWMHYDGTNTVIYATTGVETIIAAPINVAVTQNVADFGVYQDYYNTITWDASPESDLIQYSIYRNGVYFAATDTLTFEFIDNNAIEDGTVTYGVAGLNSSYRQSPITTFTLNP